ncbi:MAG TPA: acyl-CoA dehydrogenase family protein [Polyangiales bacterium]|nr:acyl-CoA dehydrogenase family protein [Polyangiales bacterium]
MIDFEHHEMLRNLAGAVEQIAKDHMRPFTREVDEHEHSNPDQYVKTMYEVLKLSGGAMSSPVMGAKEQGEKKRRTGNVTSVVFIEKLAWGDCGMYLATPMPLLGGAAVGAAGTPEQKKQFLKRFQEGDPKWAAMAITEPGSGSDSGSIQTTAELDGDQWVINGEKIFVTAGKRAVEDSEGFVVVWATVDRKAGRAGIKPFLVDHHTPGMKVVKLEKKHGIRCSDTAAIVFDNCRIPKENLLGSADVKPTGDSTGFKGAMATFDATRPPVAASAVGVGRASLEYTQEYLDKQGVKPRYGVARNKLTAVERDLMLMEAKVKASWLLTLKAAWMSDMGEPNNLEASICKWKAGRDMV